jgi:hypothetical protein
MLVESDFVYAVHETFVFVSSMEIAPPFAGTVEAVAIVTVSAVLIEQVDGSTVTPKAWVPVAPNSTVA